MTKCACGQPLHYKDPLVQLFVERQIEAHGEFIKVSYGARAWLVPRHFIALHGIKAADLGTSALPVFTEIDRREK